MSERDHYQKILNGAREIGALLFRIADAPMTGKKPFDIGGISKSGKGVAIEVKHVKTGDCSAAKALSLLADHQINWLAAYAQRGSISIVIVYVDSTKSYQCYRATKEKQLVLCWDTPAKLNPLRSLPLD